MELWKHASSFLRDGIIDEEQTGYFHLIKEWRKNEYHDYRRCEK